MKTEFLFGEVCNFYGDPQNVTYLAQSSRDPQVINTALTDEPFFVKERPDIVVMASMSEKLQRKVIEKLRPLMPRIRQLIDDGVVFLCTGNSCEIFCKKIDYITEEMSVEDLEEHPFVQKADLPVAGLVDAHDLRAQLAVPEGETRAGSRALSGTRDAVPAVPLVAQQQHLDRVPRVVRAEKARGDDAGVVQDETVPRTQQLRQLGKAPVRGPARLAGQRHHVGVPAMRRRRLRDQLGRQFIEEIGCIQTVSYPFAVIRFSHYTESGRVCQIRRPLFCVSFIRAVHF